MRLLWSGIFVLLSSSLTFSEANSVRQPSARQQRLATHNALPHLQRWRVNDTLVLVCSQLRRVFTTEDHPAPLLLWGRATLYGKRGYVQTLDPSLICTLYEAATNRYGDVLRLVIWAQPADPEDWPSPGAARAHSFQQPVRLKSRDFFYDTWDVRYRTWSRFLSADFNEIPTLEDGKGFVGDATYHLLPYWLARAHKQLTRTHHLPPAEQLNSYLALTTSPDGWLEKPYRPLLARLLRAYQAYPMPAATAYRINQALRKLH